MKLTVGIASVVFLCLPGFGANRFDVGHLDKIRRVADPQISPDGKSIVIVVSRPNFAEDRYDADLILVDASDGRQRTLTHDRRAVSSPRWSPSGDRLAFLATGVNAKPQIFVMPMTGGDAVQVTKSAVGVQQFAWRPDGKMIAFAAADEPPKKTGEEKFNDSFEVGNDDFLVKEAALPTHLWLLPSEGGEAHRLTSGAWTLPISHPPSSPASPIAWSPDGRSIAFVQVETPHSGDGDRSTLQILDVESGEIHGLTGRTKHEGYPMRRRASIAISSAPFGHRTANRCWLAQTKGLRLASGFNRWMAGQRGAYRSAKPVPTPHSGWMSRWVRAAKSHSRAASRNIRLSCTTWPQPLDR